MPPANSDDSTPPLPIPPLNADRIDRFDRFGLPTIWTLLDFDTGEREAAVADLVREVFETAVRHLGEDRARKLFVQTAAVKRGRRPNNGLVREDYELLAIFDERAKGQSAHHLRMLPRLIAEKYPQHSAKATEMRLRRALKHREASRKAEMRRQAEEKARATEYLRFGTPLLGFD